MTSVLFVMPVILRLRKSVSISTRQLQLPPFENLASTEKLNYNELVVYLGAFCGEGPRRSVLRDGDSVAFA